MLPTSTISTSTAPIAPTIAVTIPAVDPVPPEQHASRLHAVFSVLAGMLHVLESPAVMALLPAQYRGYAAAILSVEQIVETTTAAVSTS